MTDYEPPTQSDFEQSAVIGCDGYRVTASWCGTFLGQFEGEDEARETLLAKMEAHQYWPDIYLVNDHGNVTLLNYKGEHLQGWV